MSSKSFRSFKFNLIDVDRLRQTHALINNGEQGRKGLGHITRSGVVMLCAAWEHYAENLLLEGVNYFCEIFDDPTNLPKPVQKEISKAVRDSKHELKPLHLSGNGWKQVYIDHGTALLNGLNTPKSANLNDLYKRLLGVDELSSSWSILPNTLDDFVSIRGDIAHQGRHADYVTIAGLNTYREQIRQYSVDTDNFLAAFLRDEAQQVHKPWRITT